MNHRSRERQQYWLLDSMNFAMPLIWSAVPGWKDVTLSPALQQGDRTLVLSQDCNTGALFYSRGTIH